MRTADRDLYWEAITKFTCRSNIINMNGFQSAHEGKMKKEVNVFLTSCGASLQNETFGK